MKTLLLAACSLVILGTSTADAGCYSLKQMRDTLGNKHKEVPVFAGVPDRDGKRLVLFLSPNGSWTVVKYFSAKRVCTMDSGHRGDIADMPPRGEPT